MNQKITHILLLLAVCCFSFFIHNRVIYADIMESRNLVTAREIVEEGNWLIPTMNGVLRLEKPPLPTWVAACIEMISPDNLALQRSAAGVMAVLLVLFLYLFVVQQTQVPLLGLFSGLLLCTSFNIVLMGRVATWDIYCHAFMLGGIYFLYRAGEKSGKCYKEFLWAGIFMGLSFLGKGPVSFYALLLPFLISWLFFYRPSFRGKMGGLFFMLLLCLIISFWWPISLLLTHKEVFLSVMDKESTAWLERNVRPWYYYWKFFLETGIWALVLVTILVFPYWKKRISLKKEYLFSVCWIFLILFFLSLMPEKKTRYLLPILIPSAVAMAHFFYYYWQKSRSRNLISTDKWIWRINTLLLAFIVCCLPIGGYLFLYATEKISLGLFSVFVIGMEVIAVILFYNAFKQNVKGFLWGIVGLFFFVEAILLPMVATLFNNPYLNSIRAVRTMERLNNLPFYSPCEEELRIEIVYEAGRKILPFCFESNQPLPSSPFVLVSACPIEQYFTQDQLTRMHWELIGKFDDNKRPENRSLFVRYVTLVEPME